MNTHDKLVEHILQDYNAEPRPLPLEFLRRITRDFSDKGLLGEGGFGRVYKGVLQNGKTMIAVKKLHKLKPGVQEMQFENEVYNLMRLRHPNVVRFVGYCYEAWNECVEYNGKYVFVEVQQRLLCLEYLTNGSLDNRISDESSGLDWYTRYKIIKGICCGLHYLHEECKSQINNASIIHRDLKPANILLDENMVPKIADFGLSKLFDDNKSQTCTKNFAGSLGYMAPEYIHELIITTKADIYSLGVIIIDIITGGKKIDHSKLDFKTSNKNIVEPILNKWRKRPETAPSAVDCEQIRNCLQIGLSCMKSNRNERPTTGQIIQRLNRWESTNCNISGERPPAVQETIKKQVVSMYVWPETLEEHMMDRQKVPKPAGILHVEVVKAQNLQNKDLGKSNPYVKLKVLDSNFPSKLTTVKRKNINPEWHEEFKFIVTNPNTSALEVNVFNWEQGGKHKMIGMNMIPLRELQQEEYIITTLVLHKTMDPNDIRNEKSRGELTVGLMYKLFEEEDMENEGTEDTDVTENAPEGTPAGGGLLCVIIHEAQGLEGKYHTNPYVKIMFKGEQKKTKVIKKDREPQWENEFEFVCEEPPANDKLHVEVLSKGLIYHEESLGYVYISLADVISKRRINEKYHLIDSKNGQIRIELQWRTS